MWNHQGPKTERGNVADRETGTVNPHQHVNVTVLVNGIVLNLRKGNLLTIRLSHGFILTQTCTHFKHGLFDYALVLEIDV